MYMVPKYLVAITTVVLVQQLTTPIAGVQHLCSDRTRNHIKKIFLGAPLRCLWTASLLTSFLPALATHCHGLYTESSLHTSPTQPLHCTHLWYQLPVSPWGPTSSFGQETEKQRKLLFQGGRIVSSFQSKILFPLTSAPLTCHPQLQAGTKCTVFYTYTQRQCLCTHKPSLLSFLSLSADCIRKCSQAWNGSFDAFSSDVPCMKQLLALAHE